MSEALLSARDLRATRQGDCGPLVVLAGADLDLARGEVVDISGPSGAGKTTLLRALALMLPGAAGTLLLSGRSAAEIGARAWRSRVALVPQRPVTFPGSVRDNLLVPFTLKISHGASTPDDPALRALLDSVGLADVALDRAAERLSVGQAARVALLRTVLTAPDVLLLDEPDASLDEESAGQVTAMTARFADRGGGVVRVRHHRPDALKARRERLAAGVLHGVGDSD